MRVHEVFRTGFAKWVLAKDNDPTLKLKKDWAKVTTLKANTASFGKPGIALALLKEDKLKSIAEKIKKSHKTKSQDAFSEFQRDCWEALVDIFFNADGDDLMYEEMLREPMTLLWRKYFTGSWRHLEKLCVSKANSMGGDGETESDPEA